jgi:hypothetical protein
MSQTYPIVIDIDAYRGDTKEFSETDFFGGFKVDKDVTTRKINFGVKLTPSDSDRIIDKKNTVDGGSDSEVELTLSNSVTTIVPKILPSDTQGETTTYCVYEIISVDASDATDKETLFKGNFKLLGDVLRPNDTDGGSPGLNHKYFTNEDLIGTKNGVNLVFTVGKVIREYSETVRLGNMVLNRDTQYTVTIGSTDTTITLIVDDYIDAPISTDILRITYVEV